MGDYTSTARCGITLLLIAAMVGITIGIITILKFGYSKGALIALTTGGYLLVFVFVVVSVLGLLGRRNATQEQPRVSTPAPLPCEDFPPMYRLAWRQEYIKKSPTHLNVNLESYHENQSAEVTEAAQIWTTHLETGVHSLSTTPHVLPQNDSVVLTPKGTTGLAQNIDRFNEGLPSYAEVLSWR